MKLAIVISFVTDFLVNFYPTDFVFLYIMCTGFFKMISEERKCVMCSQIWIVAVTINIDTS